MSKLSLENAIKVVNNRYAKGMNDDDQVAAMIRIANKTKGYYFMPKWDTYELCTDLERLEQLAKEHGYWSDSVQRFNTILQEKGGHSYMTELNNKIPSNLK